MIDRNTWNHIIVYERISKIAFTKCVYKSYILNVLVKTGFDIR